MKTEGSTRPRATIADFFAIDEEHRYHELLMGEIVRRPAASGLHGAAHGHVVSIIGNRYDRRAGGRHPGGWWLAMSCDIRFGENLCCPDVAGWRRDGGAERPRGQLVEAVPNWICEILSRDNPRNDLVRKKHIYHEHKVGHYWIADPDQGVLLVYRWVPDGYLEVLSAEHGQRVTAEPFGAAPIAVGALFGDDDDDEP